jgi:predicted house-cleaning noncanonical NTP pyrophosphatase (MazG superfamily)
MKKPDLIEFLQHRMSMTDVYQPVVIKELILHEGTRTKAELATALAAYDLAVQEYYERIVTRWPKITLTKHGIIDYERRGSVFRLLPYPDSADARLKAVRICEEKIGDWLEKRKSRERAPEAGTSVRYEVLKEAHGKCQLCGISSEISPIDIDHIIPRSKADKNGKVRLHGRLIDVNDRENLQALCFACDRAKRDADETDFRRRNKLIRDRIPEIIEAEGRKPLVKALTGQKLHAALFDKLTEEYAELLAAKDGKHKLEELADIAEVVLALAGQYGADEKAFLFLVPDKRAKRGSFSKGFVYLGDDTGKER